MRLLGKQLSFGALVGLGIVLGNSVVIVFAPVLAPYGQADLIGDVWAPASYQHLLGLDNLGRDMFSRLLFGARTTICVALIITLCAFAIGIVTGFGAAVAGRWVDAILSRLVDAIMGVPTLIFALIVLSVLGTSLPVLIGTISVLESTRVFRLCRAIGLDVVVMDFVEVARLRGEGLWWILRRELLPNTLYPIMTEFGLRFSFALLFIAALSFLGLGIQPPEADWGGMVRDNADAIAFGGLAPLIPAAAIAQVTIGVNLVVDWLLAARGDSQLANA